MLFGTQNGKATLEYSLAMFYKTEHSLTIDPSWPCYVFTQLTWKFTPIKKTHTWIFKQSYLLPKIGGNEYPSINDYMNELSLGLFSVITFIWNPRKARIVEIINKTVVSKSLKGVGRIKEVKYREFLRAV